MKPLLRAILPALLLFSSLVAQARVIWVDVLTRTQIPADPASGIPAYEKISARAYFAISPTDPHNQPIIDLDKAPRNRHGEVEFSADLFLLRPITKSNGALLLEIPNRGGKGLLSLIDGGKADPATPSDLGDAWLLKQGFTFASLGWQWDAPLDSMRLYAPIAYEKDGTHITGLLRSDYTPSEPMTDIELGHLMGNHVGGTEYPVAAPQDPRNTLTVRDTPHGPRTTIPRTQWSFGYIRNPYNRDSPIIPRCLIHLASGFQPGKIYELVYAVEDPKIAGLGFAAVREFVAWEKHSPDAIAPVKFAYAAGISQCGRFLRDLLYQGFNADESNRIALDGILAHVGGAGRGSFNYRFAQPSRDAQPMSSIDWPTDIFPFTDLPEADPLHPTNPKQGLLDTATAQHVVPKIFLSHTSYEYWGRAASLMHTTADAKADVSISPNVRIYFFSGLQHFSVPFPPEKGTGDRLGQQLPSPLPIRWFWRAMITNMNSWVQTNTAPPQSRYPKISDGTLVGLDKLHFPTIPGIHPPASNTQGWILDFGPGWQHSGILTKQPPTVGAAYPTLVPQVDADGNDLGGIRLPEITAPLATYTGWNLRDPSIGAPAERTAFLGSFLPLPRTATEATTNHDPRKPIEDRYKTYPEYRAQFQKSLDELVSEHYILQDDAEKLLDHSGEEWNWSMVIPAPPPTHN
jgi:Alpha/beta hydrolase domain